MWIEPDMSAWQGRVDPAEGELALRWHQVVRRLGPEAARGIGVVGFASDEGVRRNQGRVGAAEGPPALRRQLANLPAWSGLDIFDAGTIGVDGEDLESAQSEYAHLVARLLGQGLLPIGLGGGHEIALGTFLGLAEHLGSARRPPRVGILNLDAHFDLRLADRGTSGTSFRQIAHECDARGWDFHYCALGISAFSNTEALFQAARALGVVWRLDDGMGYADLRQVETTVSSFLADIEVLYLTVCLDVLPASDAPGVSAPSARGVPLDVLEKVIDLAGASGKLRVADVAELNPRFDDDFRTARVAARIVGRIAARGGRRA